MLNRVTNEYCNKSNSRRPFIKRHFIDIISTDLN